MASLRRLAFLSRVIYPSYSSHAHRRWLTAVGTGAMENTRDILQATFTESQAGTMIAEKRCKRFCQFYRSLEFDHKIGLLQLMCHDYGVNQDNVITVAQHVLTSQEKGDATLLMAEDRLRNALTPKYRELFSQIGRIEDGVKFLVDLRADILTYLAEHTVDHERSFFQSLSTTLRELLALWFSVGFLSLQRVTWESSCDMVQKISDYEAVHPIRSWADLKRRVGPYRRCFVFTHNSMPREPVVVLHTALSNCISSTIHSIVPRSYMRSSVPGSEEDSSVDANNDTEDPSLINTAVFYSITSTQKGLQGVDLGNYLIKRVVRELQAEFPPLSQFSSLSPIPGFRDWLVSEINKFTHKQSVGEFPDNTLFTEEELSALQPLLATSGDAPMSAIKQTLLEGEWVGNENLRASLKSPLMRLCARYLYLEKRRAMALNPVANFHLGNGAVMWRLNWLGDTGSRGVSQSCGLMVNYRYYLEQTEENSRRYLEERHITASDQIVQLCHAADSSL